MPHLPTMQNAIDFKELRRQERQRTRSSKPKPANERCLGGLPGSTERSTTNIGEVDGLFSSPADQSMMSASCPSEEYSLDSYTSLLPRNQISEDIHRIRSPTEIDSVLYAEHFLAPDQSKEIMSWLQTIPEYSQHDPRKGSLGTRLSEREESVQHNGKWTRLKHARRKVALFDGSICNLPPILQRLSNTLVAVGAFPSSGPPNHVLVNEYQPGEGIMPHTDGPAYESRTATISLGGSDVIFKLWPRQDCHNIEFHSSSESIQPVKKTPSLEVILHGNGSLVLFTNDAYLNHCHEIAEGILEETTSSNGVCGNDINGKTLVERGYRVSLTFRSKKK